MIRIRRLPLFTPAALAVLAFLWIFLPLTALSSSPVPPLITISGVNSAALEWLFLTLLATAGVLLHFGWRFRTVREQGHSLLPVFLVVLGLLFVLWVIIPAMLLGESAGRAFPVAIRARSKDALSWFYIALLATAGALILAGQRTRLARERRRHRDDLLALARDHLDEGMALCNRRGQPIWINATGSKLLLIDGQPNPDVARLVRRAAETLHVASQSLTVRENLRVNVQAVPLGGASVGLIARPMQNQADPNNFYERFMRRIVHDMRNPLAAIIAHASNLYTGPTPENGGSWETWQTTARTIEHEAQRLTRLVDSILFEARLSHVPLAIERLDLVDVIEEVVFQFDEVAQQAGRTLAAETPPGAAPLEADRDLLVRALSNLVDNGLKYSRPASTVRILLETTREAYLLRVIDSGEGIPPEYLPDRIFEPLVRARPRDGGSGLGLSIVKKIAEMHRGAISAESKPGEGTTMTLCLPR